MHGVRELERLQVDRGLAGGDAGDVEQVVDEADLRGQALLDRAEAGLDQLRLVRSAEELHPAVGGGQWRAQLVRQSGQELVLRLLGVLAVGDVDDRAEDARGSVDLDQRRADHADQLLTVLDPEPRFHVRYALARTHAPEALGAHLRIDPEAERVGRAPNRFLARVARHLHEAFVDVDQRAVGDGGDGERERAAVEGDGELRLRLAQRRLGTLLFRDVAGDDDGAEQLVVHDQGADLVLEPQLAVTRLPTERAARLHHLAPLRVKVRGELVGDAEVRRGQADHRLGRASQRGRRSVADVQIPPLAVVKEDVVGRAVQQRAQRDGWVVHGAGEV
jgi:hypothetical protein